MKRKDLFKQGIRGIFKVAFESTDDLAAGISKIWQKEKEPIVAGLDEIPAKGKTKPASKKSKKKLFQPALAKPPGSHPEYFTLCTGCKECVFACPYSVLFTVENSQSGKSYAFFDPNDRACHLCSDYPCVSACPTGALLQLGESDMPKWGKAKGIFEYCINSKTTEKTCTACQTACPVDETIKFLGNKPTFSKKTCTGCGLCTEVCPTFPKAILVSGLERHN